MRQQINLFQSILVDKPKPFRAAQVQLLLLLLVALLALLSLFGYWQMTDADRKLKALQREKSSLEATVMALEMQYPERVKSVLLGEEIKRVKLVLEGQIRLLGYFSVREGEDNSNGRILAVLEGLARHRSPGVWLRRINLDASGQRIALAGTALKPEQVPEYLQLLGEQKVLGGKVFSSLKLARLEERSGKVDFSLESLEIQK